MLNVIVHIYYSMVQIDSVQCSTLLSGYIWYNHPIKYDTVV